jgi:hypothetical protein
MCLTAAFLLGCSGNNTTTTPPDASTLIAVDPSDFPVDAACGRTANAMGAAGNSASTTAVNSYVAELLDLSYSYEQKQRDLANGISQPEQEFVVQSSPATPCSKSVAFAQVSPLRLYAVRVTTYVDPVANLDRSGLCTRNGTNIAVVRGEGDCNESTQLATAIRKFKCFGWIEPSPATSTAGAAGASGAPSIAEVGAAGSAPDADATGTEETPTVGAAGAGANGAATTPTIDGAGGGAAGTGGSAAQWRGRPAMAVEYRTVTLRYCQSSDSMSGR